MTHSFLIAAIRRFIFELRQVSPSECASPYALGIPRFGHVIELTSNQLWSAEEMSEVRSSLHGVQQFLPKIQTPEVSELISLYHEVLSSSWLVTAPILDRPDTSFLIGIRRCDHSLLEDLLNAARDLKRVSLEQSRKWIPPAPEFRDELLLERLMREGLPVVGICHTVNLDCVENSRTSLFKTDKGWLRLDWSTDKDDQDKDQCELIVQDHLRQLKETYGSANPNDVQSYGDTDLVRLAEQLNVVYRAKELTPMHISAWLAQFLPKERLAMYNLILGLEFFSEIRIRESMRDLHKRVMECLETKQIPLSQVVFGTLGDLGKSGALCLRLYGQSNKLGNFRRVRTEDIPSAFKQGTVKCVVFVDDIIGSGDTVLETVVEVQDELKSVVRESNATIIVAAVAGTIGATNRLQKQMPPGTEIIIDSVMQRCFDDSRLWKNDLIRNDARRIAKKYGSLLEPRHPLGYSNGQLLALFPDNCPDNTLPILWAQSNHVGLPNWKPLFPR